MAMKEFVFLFLCLASPLFATKPNSDPIVTVDDGKLKGVVGQNVDGERFYKFFGIPYAKPPLGQLRFKPPQTVDPWTGIRDATKHGDACLSRDILTPNIVGSEDCLYLNVYTRNLPSKHSRPKPVMVYIYGGGLTMGSSGPEIVGPEFLMLKDIVLVTFNYRLGVLGFLSFDDPKLDVPGNNGLKDQVLALKWIQKNIKKFNGDPQRVTLFGNSAGGESIHTHILSPVSEGLFHGAILQSGWVLTSLFWGSKNNAKELVSKAGKSAKTDKEALDILKTMTASEIFAAQEQVYDSPRPAGRRPFSAVLETPNDSAFLTQNPVETLKQGHYNQVPMMMGYAKDEGMLFDLYYIAVNKTSLHIPEYDLREWIPFNLDVPPNSPASQEIVALLQRLYANLTIESRYNPPTDSVSLMPMMEALKLHLATITKPIYVYRMSLSAGLNQFKRLLNITDEPGTGHTDELGYLFHTDITPRITPGSLEDRSMRSFVDLWTNFAVHENPTPKGQFPVTWQPVTNPNNFKVLDIGREICAIDFPERNRMNVWGEILRKWPLVKFS